MKDVFEEPADPAEDELFPRRRVNSSGETALLLILIGLILQFAFVLVFFFIVGIAFIIPIFGAILLAFALLALLFVGLVYFYSYRPTKEGDYSGAKTPTLVFAILSLLVLSIVPGVFYLIGYVKLIDAEEEASREIVASYASRPSDARPSAGEAPTPAFSGATATARYCGNCGAEITSGQRFCIFCRHPTPQ